MEVQQPSSSSTMEVAKSVMYKIGETFANFESKASSMFSLLEQWRKLESEFAAAEASMAEKEREVDGFLSRVESLQREVELRKQRIDNRGFELRKFEEELNLREEKIEVRFEKVEVKEKKVNELYLECQRELKVKKDELVAKHRGLVVKEKSLIEESKKLEVKAERIIEERKELEVKEKELSEGVEELELRRREVDDRFREVELKEEGVRGSSREVSMMQEEVRMKEKELSERFRELELKRREVDDRSRVVELKEEEVRECSKRVDLMKVEVEKKERGVNERFRGLEDHEKRIVESCKGLELMEKEVGERIRAVEERSNGIELRMQNEVELREKQLKEGFEALEVKIKEVEECCNVLNANEMELISRRKELELREQSIDERYHGLESNEKQINERCQSLELKEKELNEGLKALESKEKKFDEECKEMKIKMKEIYDRCKVVGAKDTEWISRERALELREQSVDISCQSLELKEKEFDEQCQSLKLKAKELNEGFQALELKERKLDEEYKEMSLKKKEIDDAFEALEVKEKQIRRRHKVLDLREQQINECCKEKEIKVESNLSTSGVASSSISLSDDLQSLCKNMNAKGLRTYLLQHVKEYDTLNDNMLDSLGLAADPAKLVLNVIKSHNELEFEEVSTSSFAAGCIYLLVHLLKLRVCITSCVKDEAMKLSDIWRLLLGQSYSHSENFGYLLYIASFNLAEIHDTDELLSLFITFCDETKVYQPELLTLLCGALGLRGKIADIIQSLILRDKKLQALRYIFALKMECDYPLISLLRGHLDKIEHRINVIHNLGNRTAQDDAKNVELTALKEVLECISSFKQESSCSHVSLELPINQLEKEREESEGCGSLSSIKRRSQSEKESVKNMPEASNSSVSPSDSQIGKKRSAHPSWEEKDPRVHTHHGMMPYNPSRPQAHIDCYQYPVFLHQTFHPVRWPGYPLHPYCTMYGFPYNTSSGAYAWNQAVRR